MLHFHLLTLFPEFFASPLRCGLMDRAVRAGLLAVSLHNPRDYGAGRHRQVDDRPYGGGPGMVMQAEPVARALADVKETGRILLLTPAGRPFTQSLAQALAGEEHLTLICGRYEGLDARLGELFPLEPVCFGEAVLNGGESAALAVMEAVARLRPGFMGKPASGEEESFSQGLLEYPQYTRPDVLRGLPVPEVLCSGDHGRIALWRREQALATTLRYRPDLLMSARLDARDAAVLAAGIASGLGSRLCFFLPAAQPSWSAPLTDNELQDMKKISRAYGLGPVYLGAGQTAPVPAGRFARAAASLAEAAGMTKKALGGRPMIVAYTARWPRGKTKPPPLAAANLRETLRRRPVLLCPCAENDGEIRRGCDAYLRPLRFLGYNPLPLSSAIAILADRILGDMY